MELYLHTKWPLGHAEKQLYLHGRVYLKPSAPCSLEVTPSISSNQHLYLKPSAPCSLEVTPSISSNHCKVLRRLLIFLFHLCPRVNMKCLGQKWFCEAGCCLSRQTRQAIYVLYLNIEVRLCSHCCKWKEKYDILWECVCSLKYAAWNAHTSYCHLWLIQQYNIFPNFS